MSILLALAMLAAPSADGFDLSGHTAIARLHAEGAQIYACSAKADGSGPVWTFREPIATLMEGGKTVGRHFAGPHWELDDGSLVKGSLLQGLPGATASDIPLLRLSILENRGKGRLAQANEVYRLETHSGALSGPCDKIGDMLSVPYSADYLFTR